MCACACEREQCKFSKIRLIARNLGVKRTAFVRNQCRCISSSCSFRLNIPRYLRHQHVPRSQLSIWHVSIFDRCYPRTQAGFEAGQLLARSANGVAGRPAACSWSMHYVTCLSRHALALTICQVAKLKIHQYLLRSDSPNLMLAKFTRYTVLTE